MMQTLECSSVKRHQKFSEYKKISWSFFQALAEDAEETARRTKTIVTLSYRGEAFGRIKEKNRQRLHEAESNGQLTVLLQSTVTNIEQDSVILNTESVAQLELSNDAVIVCAGGILPTPALKEMGVMVETHFGALVN